MAKKAAPKKKAAAGTRKFEDAVLNVEAAHFAAVRAAMKKKADARARVERVLEALGSEVSPSSVPRWIVLEDGDIGQVVHLDEPVFQTTAADGDVFFGEFERARLVYKSGKTADAFAENADSGEGKKTPVGDRDVAKIDSFETASDVVLTDIEWIDPPPKTLKEFSRLLGRAADALFGEMDGYDVKDHEDAGRPAAPVAASGPSALFLGNEERTGNFALAGPAKAPKIAWRAEWIGDGGEWGGNPVVADGVIYAGGGNRQSTHVAALDPKNGKQLWKWEPPNKTTNIVGQLCVARGLVFTGTFHGFFAIDAKSGRTRWKAGLTKIVRGGGPLVVGDLVYVLTERGVFGLSLENGRKKFSLAAKQASGSPAHRNGILYVTMDKKLVAIDLAKGKPRWTAPAQEYPVSQAGPALAEDLVLYAGKEDLAAVDAETGKPRWSAKPGEGEGLGSGTLALGGGQVIFRADDGAITARGLRDGKLAWQCRAHAGYGIGGGSPVIAGDTVYSVGVESENSTHTRILAVDLGSGKLRWAFDAVPKDVALSWYCTPAVVDGMLLVSAYGLAALK